MQYVVCVVKESTGRVMYVGEGRDITHSNRAAKLFSARRDAQDRARRVQLMNGERVEIRPAKCGVINQQR